MKTLSIVVPAYNEEAFIATVLERVLAVDTESLGFHKEVIFVDDGSTDHTLEIAGSFSTLRCFEQRANLGKGRAVQRGIRESAGDYVLVQDADLEYDPQDYLTMLRALGEGPDGRVAVYGSRTRGQIARRGGGSLLSSRHPYQSIGPWLAGLALTLWTALLYGRWITDTLTAYKLYPARALKHFEVRTHGFESDHEITAKLIRSGVRIVEVPISYAPRSRAEGKKIAPRDGVIALWTLLRFRF